MSRSLEVQFLKQELLRLRQELHIRPIGRLPTSIARTTVQRLWIIGGNVLSTGHEAIQYSATVTPAAVYNPDVDVVYPVGLGNAWLFVDGVRQTNRVLVHHDFTGYTQPLLAGRIMTARGSEALVYSGTSMKVYLMDLP